MVNGFIDIIWITGGVSIILFIISAIFFLISGDFTKRLSISKKFFIAGAVINILAIIAYSVIKIFQLIF